jgi:hypothetical protein
MTAQNPYIRVPNLPNGQIADSDGNPTDDEITFRQALITSLQKNFGDEGLVAPTQSYANMLIIQNHQVPNPVTGVLDIYTCQFGTCLYVPDFPVLTVPTPSIVFCVPDGSGNPLFKRVSLL